ncbi:hypothetical protein CEXT_423411 [Caerostris extrusa]|uniref:Uncharacterized protein n=1 Tax=Caerostris extrusa TaxID=172846 RepID=A0AAV4V5C9_CAEEX|nr:hypothetical protein CEXT_423411 [Caerostris extrusa]
MINDFPRRGGLASKEVKILIPETKPAEVVHNQANGEDIVSWLSGGRAWRSFDGITANQGDELVLERSNGEDIV